MKIIDYLFHKTKRGRKRDVNLMYLMIRIDVKELTGVNKILGYVEKFIEKNCTARIERILDRRACINKADEEGDTLLHIACVLGDRKVVKIFLDRGLRVGTFNKDGNTAFHMAAMYGKTEILEFLLERGVDIEIRSKRRKETALQIACLYGKKETAEFLLSKKADMSACNGDKNNSLHLAAMHGNKEIVELLLNNKANIDLANMDKETALHLACRNGNIDIVKILLERGANVNALNKYGCTPLYIACACGKTKIVELLLDEADMDIGNRLGYTPLQMVSCIENINILKKLLAEGADMESVDKDGDTALHIACFNNSEKAVSLLIDEGANVNAVDRQGNTPLHIACYRGNGKIVQSLLEEGACTNVINKKGDIPLYIAYGLGDEDLVNKLLIRENKESLIKKVVQDLCRALKKGEFVKIGKYDDILKAVVREDRDKVRELDRNLINKLKDICAEGNRKCINGLLSRIKYISNDELVRLINISSLDAINIFVNRFGIVRIDEVFCNVDSDKREYIVGGMQGKKNLLNKVRGKLREELELKVSVYPSGHNKISSEEETASVPSNKVLSETKGDLIEDKLLSAIKLGDKRTIKKLLYRDIDLNFVDSIGNNALICAIDVGYTDVIGYLLDKGANVNVADKSGKTALMHAIENGNLEITKILINRNAELDVCDNNKKSVFMYALEKGESMSFIIDNMMNIRDVNAKDLKCSSLLMHACAGGYMRAVEQLVERGADINAVNIQGDTPLSISFNNKNIKLVEYFIKLNVLKQGNIHRKDDFNKLKKRIKENNRCTDQYKDDRLEKFDFEEDVGVINRFNIGNKNGRSKSRKR